MLNTILTMTILRAEFELPCSIMRNKKIMGTIILNLYKIKSIGNIMVKTFQGDNSSGDKYARETFHLDQTIEELNAKITTLETKVNGFSMGKQAFIPSRVQPIKEEDDEVKFIKIVKTKDEDKEEEEESVESTPENTIASQESSTSSSDTRKSGRDITKRKVMNISSTGNQSY